MNNTRKILFFDIDGTLITENGERYFPESAKEALALARKKGNLVFINTGRVFCNVTAEIRSAGFDGYVCGCGTNIIYNDEELFHYKLNKKLCDSVMKKCREYNMYAFFEYSDKVYVDAAFKDYAPLKEMTDYFRSTGQTVDDSDSPDKGLFDKFCAWYDEDNEHLQEFKEFLSRDFDYIQREGNFCEVVPKGYSKATGIKFLLDYLDIPLTDAYVFGDGSNDEPMLSYVPNSIIMKKGPDYLKKKVMLVTDNAEDDGIYKAMKKLEII